MLQVTSFRQKSVLCKHDQLHTNEADLPTEQFDVLPFRRLLRVSGIAPQHEHCDRADVQDETNEAAENEVERK